MTQDTATAHALDYARQALREKHAQRYDSIAEDQAESNPATAAIASRTAQQLRSGDSMYSQIPGHISAAIEQELEEQLQATIRDPNGDPGLRTSAGQALRLLREQARR